MGNKLRILMSIMLLMCNVQLGVALAQDAGGEAPVAGQQAAGAPDEGGDVSTKPGFVDIVFGGGIVNTLIWCVIFLASFATIALIIDGALAVKREKLLPPTVVSGVRDSLDEGDLGEAIAVCETNPGPLSNILMAGFSNINEGYEVIQESVTAATDLESEKIMQRINYLNLCGQIAPMLGLLGTVTGMVRAFGGLAEAGPARDRMLAEAISGALWTTVVGLLIAVPALLAFTIYKNLATKVLLESEATVLDLLKILRGAEVEEEYVEE